MIQLQETVREFAAVHHKLTYLKRLKSIRDLLKIVIVGFLFARDVEQKISETEKRKNLLLKSVSSVVYEALESIQKQLDEVDKSDSYLPAENEKQWLKTLESLKTNIEYLSSIAAIEEKQHLDALQEIEKSWHFIINYNKELEKKRTRHHLLKLKNDILQAENEFNTLYNETQYFTRKKLITWKDKWNHIIKPIQDSIKNNLADLDFQDSITRVNEAYNTGEQLVEKRNAEFVEKEIVTFKDFFDNIEAYPLTDEQRRAIVVDEDNNLIVAGAGTGKTSTIVAKAGYLIKKGLATPDEILLIAFNKDVATEMNERIHRRFGLRLKVKTYHSFGLEVIAQSGGVKPSVSELAEDRIKLPKRILEFIKNRMKDDDFSRLINQYFLFDFVPYKSMFEFHSHGEYIEYLEAFDIRSLKGDRVKSLEECEIANFLYLNGIDYIYEKPYEMDTATTGHRQYKPDFYLPTKGIYIEHFGIDRKNRTPPFIPQTRYVEDMNWKRNLHREHGTTLIETYSYEKKEGTLLSSLEEKLSKHGVTKNPIPPEKIFERLNDMGRVHPFTILLSTFLNLYKSCGKTLEEIKRGIDQKDKRAQTFLNIFSRIYADYTSHLENRKEIDFEDMINQATSLIQQKKYTSKFKYILVDEFQDISQSRYRLLKSLVDQNSAHLFCVGDDWQSIYRFTGSDLSIMLDFEQHFGYNATNYLTETFRFNNKLSEFSTRFILQNPNQIKKTITSDAKGDKPAITIINDEPENALTNVIKEIDETNERRRTIFIIGRYNRLKPDNLEGMAKTYPKLDIEFTTAHSSKGLEADYVILTGLTSGEHGFPCQIVDDPLINLVLAKQDPHENAEERRLFYVAVTRAKKHVYLIIDDKYRASTFISEIQQNGYEINIGKDDKKPHQKTHNCPLCKTGRIIPTQGKYGKFYSCSNYPYCEYRAKQCPECREGFLTTNNIKYRCSNDSCSFNVEICPACNDGYLVLRKGRHGSFYGCSNYPRCKHIHRIAQRKPRPRYIA